MKNLDENDKAFEILFKNAQLPEEVRLIEELKQKLTTSNRVEIIDKNHQRFNGKIYIRVNSPQKGRNKYYRNSKNMLHRDVWEYYNEPIPEGYVIHHRDHNPDNNNIENLQCLTVAEHRKIHSEDNVHKKVCKFCGKVFQSRGSEFCSSHCYSQFCHSGLSDTIEYAVKICPNCGQRFTTAKKPPEKAKYCSRYCAMVARHKKKKLELSTKKISCKKCGKIFSADKVHHRFFCSETCWRKYNYENLQEDRICEICGKIYRTNKYNKTRTCSRQCGGKLRTLNKKN